MLARPVRRFFALQRNARLYLISNTLQATSAGAIAVLYTLFLVALGYGTDFAGLVLLLGTIGGGLGILPAARLVRWLGWRGMLLLSDLIGGVAIAVQLLVPTRPVILVTTLGVGASVAIFLVVNTPFLAAHSEPSERTGLFGLNNALAFLASVAGSVLGGFLPTWLALAAIRQSPPIAVLQPFLVPGTRAQAYQLALLATGALALPSIIPVLLMRDEPARAAVTAAPPELAPVPGLRDLRKQLRLWLGAARSLLASVIGRFSLTQALVGFGAGLYFPYLSVYFVNQLGTSTAYFGVLSAGFTILLALASLVAVPLARRYGKVRTAIAAQTSSLPFLLALAACPVLWVASAAFLLRGFLMNITSPPLQAYLMEAVPAERQVVASEVYNVGYQVAFALGSGAGGLLVAVAGVSLPMFLAVPCYGLSALLLAAWFGGQAEKSA
jgi:MFS family permease